MKGIATYRGDDIYATFTARMVKEDYGVPGSPVWYEPYDITIDTLEVLGVNTDPDRLPNDVHDAIYELASDCTWEIEH